LLHVTGIPVSSRSSEMCKMDDEDDIIEIWEISDKRLSWSPLESAFIEEKEKQTKS
jgi:hypothetical protein